MSRGESWGSQRGWVFNICQDFLEIDIFPIFGQFWEQVEKFCQNWELIWKIVKPYQNWKTICCLEVIVHSIFAFNIPHNELTFKTGAWSIVFGIFKY